MAVGLDDDKKRLFEGVDYLGKPSEIGQTGTSDIPAGTTGLPAPSAPGGMAGFAGGPGRAPGPAGGQADNIAAAIKKMLGGKAEPGEGEIGGRMPTQGGPTRGVEDMVGTEPMPTQEIGRAHV